MAYPPEPGVLHSNLMDSLHGALAHPKISAQQKASYAKVLAALAQDQARMHAEAPARGAGAPEEGGGFDGSDPNRGYTRPMPMPMRGFGGMEQGAGFEPSAPAVPFMRGFGQAEQGAGFDGNDPNRPYTNPMLALIRANHFSAPENPLLAALRAVHG